MRLCLICDDHALVRDAVTALVRRRWPDAEILQAADFPSAWQLAARGPELCLVDLTMPGAAPLEGVSGVVAAAPETRLLVLTGQDDDALMLDLLRLGVAGFASKTLAPAVLAAAIELVVAGGRYLPPRLAELAPAASVAPAPPKAWATPAVTDRQLMVLRLLAQGLSNKQIARDLDLSPATVKTHVATLIAIVGATNRTEAAARARALGLL